MKILLNLLPEKRKEQIRRRLQLRFFLWQLFLALILEVFLLSIMAGIFFILSYQLNTMQEAHREQETAFTEQKTLLTYQRKFRAANEASQVIGKIEYGHLRFIRLFAFLENLLPQGVALHSVKTRDYTVLLAGRAAKRDDILMFDEALKKSECVDRVHVPISNLFSQEQVDFELDFDIKPECLKKDL